MGNKEMLIRTDGILGADKLNSSNKYDGVSYIKIKFILKNKK